MLPFLSRYTRLITFCSIKSELIGQNNHYGFKRTIRLRKELTRVQLIASEAESSSTSLTIRDIFWSRLRAFISDSTAEILGARNWRARLYNPKLLTR